VLKTNAIPHPLRLKVRPERMHTWNREDAHVEKNPGKGPSRLANDLISTEYLIVSLDYDASITCRGSFQVSLEDTRESMNGRAT